MLFIVGALVVFWVAYVVFSASARSDFPWTERRSHFRARVTVACAVGPAWLASLVVLLILSASLGSQSDGSALYTLIWVTFFLWIPVAACVPAVFFRRAGDPPGGSDDDDGGSGRDRPPSPSEPPGGIPLPDAGQARTRLRDHASRPLRDAPPRLPAREPRRTPART